MTAAPPVEQAQGDVLLPCPFCEGGANVERSFSGGPYALCQKCGAATMFATTIQEAIAAWNTRLPSAPAEPGEVERLREALKPFANLAGPINGEPGRRSYIDAIGGDDAGEELLLSTHCGNGTRTEVLYADDFRRARAALQQGDPS